MTDTIETPTRRRRTPTGVLVLPADAPRDDWMAARKSGITATDVVKIVQPSQYGSAIDVYADKVGEPFDDTAGEAARWGTLLEDVVAREWAERNNMTVERVGMLAHQIRSWQYASLDRLVQGCTLGGRCGAEFKTRNAYVANQWDGQIPEPVDTQIQYQLDTSGLNHMHVAALIGGQRLVQDVIYPNAAKQADIRAKALQVWQCVQLGVQPVVDESLLTIDILNRIYQHREGTRVLPGSEVRQMLAEYREAGEGGKAFKAQQDEIKKLLITMLADGDEAVDENSIKLFTFKRPKPKTVVDLDRLKADHPLAYLDVVSVKQDDPRFYNAVKAAS